ncbi:MAG: LytTR family DNA-binding domain-containing protein [Bacteroidota bacterium]
MKATRLLLLEDDSDFLQLLTMLLHQIGITSITAAHNFNECISYFDSEQIDVCLFDIDLGSGKQTGIDAAKRIRAIDPSIPVIFLTSLYNERHYTASKSVQPIAFLNKQLDKLMLLQAIDLATETNSSLNRTPITQPTDRIFVKVGNNYKAIATEKVSYFVADKKFVYCVVDNRKYPIRMTLKEIEKKLGRNFIRTHRAHVVNVDLVDSVNLVDNSIKMENSTIPLGPSYKSYLLDRIPWFK